MRLLVGDEVTRPSLAVASPLGSDCEDTPGRGRQGAGLHRGGGREPAQPQVPVNHPNAS